MSHPIDLLRAIAVRYNLTALHVFGSRAGEVVQRMAGEAVPSAVRESDVDIGAKIVAERAAWVRRVLMSARALPLNTYDAFRADPRNAAAAESHLRRALEALLDLGRHVLAKGFGRAVTEYKDVARTLAVDAVLTAILGWIERHPDRVDQSL
jgi:hypothetical protein